MDTCTMLTSPLHCLGPQEGVELPIEGWAGLPTSVNLNKTIPSEVVHYHAILDITLTLRWSIPETEAKG